ncbi:hypothetical protein MTR67_035403 [Solanum verrucosum]|uniref:Uncharacterized protein n=1 Tax=Solanum verrucosum TaxID=315347 RepID=A0AAF0ZLF8_SOLVR|nr:hypothetical protein MTR67_035403 [Solanum verrucosum]
MPRRKVGIMGAFVLPLRFCDVAIIGLQYLEMLMHFASDVSNVSYKGVYLRDMNYNFRKSLRLSSSMFGGLISWVLSLALLGKITSL